MKVNRTIWHDQLFFILLAVSVVCFGLTRIFQVRFFALPAMVLMAPRSAVGGVAATMSTLKRENQRLSELVVRQELDNAFWRNQAGDAARESLSARYLFQKAAVVGRDPQSLVRTLVVDRGLLNGVHNNMAAITDAGVAGRVTETGANLAFVATVLNPRFRAAALDARSRVIGVVGFRELNLLAMDYVLPEMDIAVGDTIVTSGTGGIFPKGLRLGIVSRADSAPRGMFRRIDVKPFVNIAALENVYLIEEQDWNVVQRRQQDALDELKRKDQAELRRLLESSKFEPLGKVDPGAE